MLNKTDFDMLASPNYAYQIYDGDGSAFNVTGPPGSAEAEHAFQSYFTKEAQQNWTEVEFDGRSDYGPFLDVGIACGGLATGAEGIKTEAEEEMFGGQAGVAYDINYHGPGDNVTNLDMGAWIEVRYSILLFLSYHRDFETSSVVCFLMKPRY
jgi:aminopeptidase Y